MPHRKRAPRTRRLRSATSTAKLHAKLANVIGERIVRGVYAPGTLLPNEAEWGRMFKASRTTVREAIKTLNAKGLLVSRTKVGSRVEPREHWNLLDRDVIAWHCAAMAPEAFLEKTQEARKLLEPGIAALAAVKRTDRQLAALQHAFKGMRDARSAEEMISPDVDFHRALLAGTNNELLAPFGIMIEQSLANLFDYTSRHNPKPESAITLHENVVTAIAAGDPAAAKKAMTELLGDTDDIIAARQETAEPTKT